MTLPLLSNPEQTLAPQVVSFPQWDFAAGAVIGAAIIAQALSVRLHFPQHRVLLAFLAPAVCALLLYLVARWARRSPLRYRWSRW